MRLRSRLFMIVVCCMVGGWVTTRQEVALLPPVLDPRLAPLNVTYRPATNCVNGCWRLVSAMFEDTSESGGSHHIFVRLLTATGEAPANLAWHAAYPDNDVRIMTKAAPEWADFPLYAEYDPDEGETGPYYAYAGDMLSTSDSVWGMGLPERQHVSFRLIWQWATPEPLTPTPDNAPCSGCEIMSYLPLIQRD
jgi:hypothetical protein